MNQENQIQIPTKLYNQLSVKAASTGISVQDYLEHLLETEASRIRLELQYRKDQEELGLFGDDFYLTED